MSIRACCSHPQALYGRLDRVFVPDMYEELTTQRVLVMEWVNGSRLRSGTDGVQLAQP
jgi:predicted unusual protein kinase regulating ubiquinone biosynthesis (AarF/ABC1/UbiB family)